MAEEQHVTKLNQIVQIAQIVSSLSLIAGIFAAFFTIYNGTRSAKTAIEGVRLSTISTLKEFIDSDVEARQKADRFLSSKFNSPDALRDLIKEKGSGERAYDSDELKDLRDAGHHYEIIATLVKLDYVDFNLIYQTIPFPYEMWNATTEFRTVLRTKNWSGEGQGLRDFWINSEELKARYDAKRKNAGAQ